MSTCTYVRRAGDEFEFGHVKLVGSVAGKEKREHFPLGTRPTMEDALAANSMALKGSTKIGFHKPGAPLWKD